MAGWLGRWTARASENYQQTILHCILPVRKQAWPSASTSLEFHRGILVFRLPKSARILALLGMRAGDERGGRDRERVSRWAKKATVDSETICGTHADKVQHNCLRILELS